MGDEDVVTVSVKWMGKKFDDLEFQLNEPVELFQAQLFSLTGVPPERQKLMYKGVMLNNSDAKKVRVTNGAKIMMIGNPEKFVESAAKVKILESMTREERERLTTAEKALPLPAGLMNLGNSCYFNAVFHFLRPVHELWGYIDKLKDKADINQSSDNYQFLKSLLDMWNLLPKTEKRYVPLAQVALLRKINPLFSRKDERTGAYLQQDAEECLSSIFTTLNSVDDEKVVDDVFGYVLSAKLKPKEPLEEGASETAETTRESGTVLNCYMGTQLKSVGTIMDGILLSLNEDVEKFSEAAGRDMIYEKIKRISTPPKYLIVHLVRFEWKQQSEVSKTEAVKAKVCRRVNFERILDITQICDEELKPLLNTANGVAMKKDFDMETAPSGALSGYELYPGEYATGRYELQSIVTHQGRTAEGGHYICWSKDMRKGAGESPQEKTQNKAPKDLWIQYDDEKVTELSWGSFDLCGGRSDYHIAVLLLYKAQCVRFPEPVKDARTEHNDS